MTNTVPTNRWNKKKTTKQFFYFLVIGAVGVLVNGLVFSLLSKISFFNGVPWQLFSSIPPLYNTFFFLDQITWAWGIGILVACLSNFILNKIFVFKES